MKPLLFALSLCLLQGCASTTFYNGRDPILKTQANITNLNITKGDLTIHADRIDQATPTRAGGSAAGTWLSGITAAIAAWFTGLAK